ncbi:hypothetical protein JOF56_002436 [Kibdelosporangium banguiense]|uniref:Zinc-binding dehydrogenase n=1 Tax=Kibdelosporangium banguiense TaxID=1365924 RepID=A0ABS4TC89_9PSEU|nr:zinc-binding dehydrogenase [Kibdelosporangium banguiense]MBP2322051.1 hypothetical protein [Kibdelosporangium banguiense]
MPAAHLTEFGAHLVGEPAAGLRAQQRAVESVVLGDVLEEGDPAVFLTLGKSDEQRGQRLVEDLLGEVVLVPVVAVECGQSAKALGVRVIGSAGPGKLQAVREFGADEAVEYGTWSGDASVVLDAVGGKIGEQAIATATDRVGIYGFASGAWPTLDAAMIAERGLTVIGPFAKLRSRTPAEQSADVAKAMTSGLVPRIHAVYPLEDAAQAHTDLEERRNIGTVLLSVK